MKEFISEYGLYAENNMSNQEIARKIGYRFFKYLGALESGEEKTIKKFKAIVMDELTWRVGEFIILNIETFSEKTRFRIQPEIWSFLQTWYIYSPVGSGEHRRRSQIASQMSKLHGEQALQQLIKRKQQEKKEWRMRMKFDPEETTRKIREEFLLVAEQEMKRLDEAMETWLRNDFFEKAIEEIKKQKQII